MSKALFAQHINEWVVKTDSIDPLNYYGITVANGMVGIVSSPEPFEVKNVVLSGAYDLYGRGRVSNFLKSFNLLNMYLDIDGDRIDRSNIKNFHQELDMRHAAFTTSFDYKDKATVTYTYYALRNLPFTVLINVAISAKKNIEVEAASIMETPDALKDAQNYFNEISAPGHSIKLLTSTARSPTGKLLMCASNAFVFSNQKVNSPSIQHEMRDNNLHLMKFAKNIGVGETFHYSLTGSSMTSAHDSDPLNEVERLTIFASLEGPEKLVSLHNAAWDELWKSDIKIEGDDQSQQDVHNMLYHLYSFSRAGNPYMPSPMGLSGLGYNGHIFWDADLWMFPVMLVLQPEIAKSYMEYRFDRLEAAKKNAFSHGFKGAMFPWESAASGREETPVWALSGPFEHHITACVGVASWNYYCVSRDKKWLLEKGWPLLSATADFWASRVERNGKGSYDIKNVVASDEWAEGIDNDAFTNAAAKTNLTDAIKAAKVLGIRPDPDWQLVADNIPIHQFPDGTTKEFDTYGGQGIKQADVNLLAYPLKTITEPARIESDLKYYQGRIPHEGTPAMTEAIFSILYSRLGKSAEAYQYFKESYLPNLVPPFRVIAETKGGTNPYFATGAGGILQSILMGFGGLDITQDGITQLKTKLPSNWKSLTITGVGMDKTTFIIK